MGRVILAMILASIAFSMWGYLWYATVFDDVWQSLIGQTETDLLHLAISRGPIQDVFVLLISLVQAIGIYLVLVWRRARTFVQHIGVSIALSTLIVLPSIGNATLFTGTQLLLLLLDYGHFLLGYAGIAFVFFIMLLPRNSQKLERN